MCIRDRLFPELANVINSGVPNSYEEYNGVSYDYDPEKAKPRTRLTRRGFRLVPVVGLEPTRCCHQRILSRTFERANKVKFIHKMCIRDRCRTAQKGAAHCCKTPLVGKKEGPRESGG